MSNANELWQRVKIEQKARIRLMPTEYEALRKMFDAHLRLKELGWREIEYCPKDGTVFEAIQAGSTAIVRCHYDGEWPKGRWWVHADGDLWPARPILFREMRDREKR